MEHIKVRLKVEGGRGGVGKWNGGPAEGGSGLSSRIWKRRGEKASSGQRVSPLRFISYA